jgi:hypothetical protein
LLSRSVAAAATAASCCLDDGLNLFLMNLNLKETENLFAANLLHEIEYILYSTLYFTAYNKNVDRFGLSRLSLSRQSNNL